MSGVLEVRNEGSAEGASGAAAGRGGLSIGGAKVSVMLLGFGQQIALSALLGAERYGDVSRVLAWPQIVSSVVVASAMQGVSSAVSRAPAGEAGGAYRQALRVHVVVAVVAAALVAAAAGPLAVFAGRRISRGSSASRRSRCSSTGSARRSWGRSTRNAASASRRSSMRGTRCCAQG
ncbi:Hypothetical protein A7982_05192 [Minicystis rosea]|nr:Hypothetical protein A7982_05192 [Minicystis rosea]